ncbi:MAG: SulP family inorganic anion transporter [Anaerolineales bacterium]|nr:SulP family inorganic anion transporter [Anaerolineales bacterium]
MMSLLKFESKTLSADAVAGLTFAIVNIPQGMANAILANVNPVLGLYTLMIATPIGALATSSVFMNVSTTSALSVAVGDTLGSVPAAQRTVHLAALVLLTGLVQLLFGVFRLGTMLRFVANSVMVGFITGVAALIVLGQTADFTGYDSPFSNKVLQLLDLILHWQQINWATLEIGLITIAVILGLGLTRFSKIAMVLALVVSTIITAVLNLESVQLVGDITQMPDKLFNFALPSLSAMAGLLPAAAAVAVIGLVQGAGVSQSYPNPDGSYPDNSRDFVGQGVANIATGFFQGIPAGGSMSGTAVTVNAGAKTRWANILAGVFVAPLVLLLGNFVMRVPMPALAGLLIVVGFQSFKPKDVLTVWQTGLTARIAMVLTFISTLVMPLQYAVFVGVIVSILLHVFTSSNVVTVVEFELVERGFPIERKPPAQLEAGQLVVLYVYGNLFFASAANFEAQLPQVNQVRRAAVLLILRGRDEIDSNFVGVLQRYQQTLQASGGALFLAGIAPNVKDQLMRTGLSSQIGEDRIFLEQPQLGVSMNSAISVARQWLNTGKKDRANHHNG